MYATTLEKRISKFLKPFGIKRAKCGKSFFYHPASGTVHFTILRYDDDKELIDFVNEKYGVDIEPFYFIFSLLHEVGHHFTIDQLTEEQWAQEAFMRELVFPNREYEHKIYFDLPAEDLADRWAIEYIDQHLQECWDFQLRCFKNMEHIYKKRSFRY